MPRYLLAMDVSAQSRVAIGKALREQESYLPKRALLIPLSACFLTSALTAACMGLALTTAYNGLFTILTVLSVLVAGASWLALDVVRRAW